MVGKQISRGLNKVAVSLINLLNRDAQGQSNQEHQKPFRGCCINTVDSNERRTTGYATALPNKVTVRQHVVTERMSRKCVRNDKKKVVGHVKLIT